MNDETRSLGDLARPAATITQAADLASGSHRGVPSAIPTAVPPGPSTAISPMSLLRALSRRLALGPGFLAAVITGPAAYFFLPEAKFKAQAKLLVRLQQPQIVFNMEHQAGPDYERYQKTQLGLIKSRWVFIAALGALQKDSSGPGRK